MVKTIVLLIFAVVIVGAAIVLLLASRKPDIFRVQRSIVIAAPPEAVFPYIDDLHAWSQWSPYDRKDPAMRRDYTGAPRGVGAAYAWDGNKEVGAGRMEIVESNAPSRVRMQLDFVRPFEGHNIADFTLAPDAGGTRVTWDFHGPAPLVNKVMQVFFDLDTMVGRDFDAGLANLKARVERGA